MNATPPTFWSPQEIYQLQKKSRLPGGRFAAKLGVSYPTYCRWIKDPKHPRYAYPKTIYAMALDREWKEQNLS